MSNRASTFTSSLRRIFSSADKIEELPSERCVCITIAESTSEVQLPMSRARLMQMETLLGTNEHTIIATLEMRSLCQNGENSNIPVIVLKIVVENVQFPSANQ